MNFNMKTPIDPESDEDSESDISRVTGNAGDNVNIYDSVAKENAESQDLVEVSKSKVISNWA